MTAYTIPFAQLGRHDVETVGGKNASLGEMISHLAKAGVAVPGGFATTAQAYRDFLQHDGLAARISQGAGDARRRRRRHARERRRAHPPVDPGHAVSAAARARDARIVRAHERRARHRRRRALLGHRRRSAGRVVRRPAGNVPQRARATTRCSSACTKCSPRCSTIARSPIACTRASTHDAGRAVRRRAAHGAQRSRLERRHVHARHRIGLPRRRVHHRLVRPRRNGRAGRGESGRVLRLQARAARRPAPILRRTLGAQGHQDGVRRTRPGERVATVDVAPEDRARFSITDADVIELAKQALIIEEHYGCPMDIEWGKDGETGKIYILQARPETVQSRAGRTMQRFALKKKSKVLATGRSIGQRIGAGPARIIRDVKEMTRVQTGDVLVADMTDPDWEPVMKRAAAIVTNRGGRTCHAAIIARELGIPAVVGCGDATETIREGARRSPCRAPKATPASSTTARCRSSSKLLELDSLPPIPTQDHDERRQPGPRVRLRRHPAPGRRPRAAGVHHQPHDRRASARAARIRPAATPELQQNDPRADGRLRRSGGVLRRQARRRHRARSPRRSRRSR